MATNKKKSGSRLGSYLYSTKNLIGCAAALGGPALAIAGVVNPILGLALLPPLYAIGALVAPPSKESQLQLAAGLDPTDINKSLNEILDRIAGKVPQDIGAKVASICTTIASLAQTARTKGGLNADLHTLESTATDYLPNAVQSYLDLPRTYADTRVIANGKTAHDLLIDQLDLLAEKLNEIEEALNKADANKLLAHGRFLEEKFGSSPLEIQKDTNE